MLDRLPVAPDEFAAELVRGVDEHRERIDELLGGGRAKGGRWTGMPALDRPSCAWAPPSCSRVPDARQRVVINEAVELATRFSTDDCGRSSTACFGRSPPRSAPGVSRVTLTLPVPELTDAGCGVRLRPWRTIPRTPRPSSRRGRIRPWSAWTAVPADVTLGRGAERWIAGEAERRRCGLALDLVVSAVDDDSCGARWG